MATTKKEQQIEEAREALGIDEEMSQEEEFDFVSGFFKAAEAFDEIVQPIEIRRGGKLLIKFNVHPYSTKDIEDAKEAGTTYTKNPKGPKYPKIVKKYDSDAANSYLIYLSTTAEDRAKLWDNPKFKEHFGVLEGYRLIDKVLLPGEKERILEVLNELGGYDEDDESDDDIEIAKNS